MRNVPLALIEPFFGSSRRPGSRVRMLLDVIQNEAAERTTPWFTVFDPAVSWESWQGLKYCASRNSGGRITAVIEKIIPVTSLVFLTLARRAKG